MARFAKMKAKIEPVVGEDWVKMLNEFYGLIADNGETFKKSLQ